MLITALDTTIFIEIEALPMALRELLRQNPGRPKIEPMTIIKI
mgnify:CR=1